MPNRRNYCHRNTNRTFTKGCPNLKQLCLNDLPVDQSFKRYHKLLRSFGSYNPAIEKLTVWRHLNEVEEAIDNDIILTREQSQSLQYLSSGCPLLKIIEISDCKLSTPDVSYLVNHSIHLEVLRPYCCNICDDGLTITKEAYRF